VSRRAEPWHWVTDEMFEDGLEGLVEGLTPDDFMAMPGIYEIVAELRNNDVLESLAGLHERCSICGDELTGNGECPECDELEVSLPEKQVIFIDMNGTLVDNPAVSEKAATAVLCALRGAGCTVYIWSGSDATGPWADLADGVRSKPCSAEQLEGAICVDDDVQLLRAVQSTAAAVVHASDLRMLQWANLDELRAQWLAEWACTPASGGTRHPRE